MNFPQSRHLMKLAFEAGARCVLTSRHLPNGTTQWTALLRRSESGPSTSVVKLEAGKELLKSWTE